MKINEILTEGEVVSFNTGKKVVPQQMSLRQAFGSDMANSVEDLGVSFAEKPSYWEDLEGSGPYADRAVDELGLKRVQKKLGYKLNTYTTADIYGGDPRVPMANVKHMPDESVFIVQFRNGKRYLVNKDGAKSYIRNWTFIKQGSVKEDKSGYEVPYKETYVMSVNGVDKFHFEDPEEAKEYALDYRMKYPKDSVKVVRKSVTSTKYNE